MDIDLAVIADSANKTENGKLNLMGIFDRFTPANVPFRWPQFSFAFRIVYTPQDVGEHTLQVRCTKDGTIVKQFGEINTNVQQVQQKRAVQTIILTINNFEFSEEGEYIFEVEGQGQQLAAAPVIVEQQENNGQTPQPGSGLPGLPGGQALEA